MPDPSPHGLPADAIQRAANTLAAIRGSAEILATPDLAQEERERWIGIIDRRVRELDALLRGYAMHDGVYP